MVIILRYRSSHATMCARRMGTYSNACIYIRPASQLRFLPPIRRLCVLSEADARLRNAINFLAAGALSLSLFLASHSSPLSAPLPPLISFTLLHAFDFDALRRENPRVLELTFQPCLRYLSISLFFFFAKNRGYSMRFGEKSENGQRRGW